MKEVHKMNLFLLYYTNKGCEINMVYIILGYSNPNLNSNIAEIRYYTEDGDWATDLRQAKRFSVRALADDYIYQVGLKNCISYGIEEED